MTPQLEIKATSKSLSIKGHTAVSSAVLVTNRVISIQKEWIVKKIVMIPLKCSSVTQFSVLYVVFIYCTTKAEILYHLEFGWKRKFCRYLKKLERKK